MWFLTRDHSTQVAPASAPESAAASLPAAVAPAPSKVTVGARNPAEQQRKLRAYYGGVNSSLAARPGLEGLQAKVIAVECGEKGCDSTLEFRDFESASAFTEMMDDGRFEHWFGQAFLGACPLRKADIPRIPGTVQKDFRITLHYRCD